MIPKIIHYCWFGENPMSPLIQECIKSWHRYLPDWEFILWNEDNSPLEHDFVKKALKDKKYAFVADYVRCHALYEYGGVYLDTDMELIKDISTLLNNDFFAAYEDSDQDKVSCGVIGCIKGHQILKLVLDFAEEIIKLTGTNQKVVYHPLPVNDPMQRQPDTTKAREILGWEAKVSRSEGMKITYDYFKTLSTEELLKEEHKDFSKYIH